MYAQAYPIRFEITLTNTEKAHKKMLKRKINIPQKVLHYIPTL
jgi:hypothetical protein